jgi:hypothetical protein
MEAGLQWGLREFSDELAVSDLVLEALVYLLGSKNKCHDCNEVKFIKHTIPTSRG